VSGRATLRGPVLLSALGLGALANLLLDVPGRPGLNVALWALAGVGVLVLLLRQRGEVASRETRWLVVGALGFAAALMLRDADSLALFSLFSAVLLLGLAAGHATSAWAGRATVSDSVVAAVRIALLCAAGPLGWGRGAPRPADDRPRWRRHARTLVRGTLMAFPALLVLTALLMSADAVFARMIRNLLLIDIGPLIEDLFFIGFVAWLTAGYLRAFMISDEAVTGSLRLPKPSVSAAEVAVALSILNVLFIVFMAVQLRYLFGSAELIEVTAGLTYAEYARRGFFELVAVAALVVPILLIADWLASAEKPRAHRLMRLSMLLLVVLLLGVIASAAYRMQLYQEAYGLTELRLYVSAVIVWLTAVLVWLVVTVLRGRRERFLFGSIIAGLATVAALHLLNPHAVIARVNIERALAGAEYDGEYLRSLSADAVPTLLERLEQLPEEERCRVSRIVEERWGGSRRGGWRTWNLSDWRARRMVGSEDAQRRRLAGCPEVGEKRLRRGVTSPLPRE
jgi:hypothetical protein